MMLSPVQHGQRSHRCIGQGVTQLDTLCEGSHSSSPVLREQLVFQNQGLVKGGENSHTIYSWRQTRGLQFGKKKKKLLNSNKRSFIGFETVSETQQEQQRAEIWSWEGKERLIKKNSLHKWRNPPEQICSWGCAHLCATAEEERTQCTAQIIAQLHCSAP